MQECTHAFVLLLIAMSISDCGCFRHQGLRFFGGNHPSGSQQQARIAKRPLVDVSSARGQTQAPFFFIPTGTRSWRNVKVACVCKAAWSDASSEQSPWDAATWKEQPQVIRVAATCYGISAADSRRRVKERSVLAHRWSSAAVSVHRCSGRAHTHMHAHATHQSFCQ